MQWPTPNLLPLLLSPAFQHKHTHTYTTHIQTLTWAHSHTHTHHRVTKPPMFISMTSFFTRPRCALVILVSVPGYEYDVVR